MGKAQRQREWVWHGQDWVRKGVQDSTLAESRLLPTPANVSEFPEAMSSGLGPPPYVTPLTNITSLCLSLFVCGRVFAIPKYLEPYHTEKDGYPSGYCPDLMEAPSLMERSYIPSSCLTIFLLSLRPCLSLR